MKTSRNIVENISDKLKNDKIFEILSRTYFDYKNLLQVIKELIVYNKYVEERNSDNDKNSLIETIKTNIYEKENTKTMISEIETRKSIISEGEKDKSPPSITEENKEGNLGKAVKHKEREKRQFEY